jgi:hypothetical protein
VSYLESKATTAAGGHGNLPAALRHWFSPAGTGGHQIGWGLCGDYDRAVALMRGIAAKHPDSIKPEEIHGLAGNLHQEFTHMSTAEHAKMCGGRGHNTAATEAAKTAVILPLPGPRTSASRIMSSGERVR